MTHKFDKKNRYGETQEIRFVFDVFSLQAKMDVASGEEQMVLKKRLLNYLERYFYLVCFGAYCRQEGGPQVTLSLI